MAKRISIGTWAYAIGPYGTKPAPFPEVIEKLSELNFDGFELGGFGPHPNPDDLDTLDKRDEVRYLWESKGMSCSGLAADLWGEQLITAPNNASYIASFMKHVQFCVDLGIEMIRVDTTEPPNILGKIEGEPDAEKTIDYGQALDRVVQTWKECSKIAADQGLRVAWEFEPGFALNKPSDIFRVLDGVDEDNFYAMFDTCHANMIAVQGVRQVGTKETLEGGIIELAERLSGKIGRLHLIDSLGALHGTDTSTHRPFGEGNLDFDEIMPALVAAGCPDDWWTINLCYWPDIWAATAHCKEFMDQLVEKYG